MGMLSAWIYDAFPSFPRVSASWENVTRVQLMRNKEISQSKQQKETITHVGCSTRQHYNIHVWTSYHVADVIVILVTRVDGELREICLRLGIVPGCGSRSLFGWVRPDYTSGPSRAHIKGIRASVGTQIVEARQCASAIRLARI